MALSGHLPMRIFNDPQSVRLVLCLIGTFVFLMLLSDALVPVMPAIVIVEQRIWTLKARMHPFAIVDDRTVEVL